MHLDQMFPRKSLDGADLFAFSPGVTAVTIEKIDYKTGISDIGEADITYWLKVKEFKKPFKLNAVVGQQIADLLGTRDTNQWLNRVIGIMPTKIPLPNPEGGMKMVWVVNVHEQLPPHPPTLNPNTDITGFSLPGGPQRHAIPSQIPSSNQAPQLAAPEAIGIEAAAMLCCMLEERGKTWDDMRIFLNANGFGELIAGKMPADCPRTIRPGVDSFIRDTPKVKPRPDPEKFKKLWLPPPAPPPAEVIDKRTGEVINPAAGLPGQPPNQVPEDDIPF